MKRILILLFFAIACTAKPKVPESLLQPRKMQAVMVDLINADGMIANASALDSTVKRNENRFRIYQQVLSLHGISKEQFNKSLKYYEQHPPLIKGVLDSMEQQLKAQTNDSAQMNINRHLKRVIK